MIKAWSPSKLEKYTQCPLKAKLEGEDKLCPLCFKGRTRGGFGKPIVCDAPPSIRSEWEDSPWTAVLK